MATPIKDCLVEAMKIVREDLTLDETMRKQIADSFDRLIRDRRLTDEQAFAKAQFLLRDARKDVYIAKVTKKAIDLKGQELQTKFNAIPAEQRVQAIREWLEPSMKLMNREGPAVSDLIQSEQNTTMGTLHEVWDFLFGPLGADDGAARVFHSELLGVDTGNATAKRLAGLFRKVSGALLDRIREGGVYVGDVENHALRSHSYAKIQTDRQNWTQYFIAHLDRTEHPDPQATADRMFDHLSTSDIRDPESAIISMARKLKWDSPQSELEYFYKWGEDGFAEQLAANVKLLAKKAVLVENMGPSPNITVGSMIESAHEAARVAGIGGKADSAADAARKILDAQTGALEKPDNQTLANIGSAARNWAGAIMLGKVALSSLAQDIPAAIIRGRFHRGGFGTGITNQMHAFVSLIGDAQARAYATEMGWFYNSLAAGSVGRFQAPFAGGAGGRTLSAKAALSVQRITGAMVLEKSVRSAFALHVSRTLAAQSRNAWAQLDPRYTRVLSNRGITEKSWESVRQRIKVNEVGAVDFRGLGDGDRRLLLSFLTSEMDSAVIRPGDFDRAMLSGGARRGTLSGEIATSATQFLAWPVTFFRRQVAYEWQMGKSGFLGFGAAMTMSGVLTTQLYAIASGQPAYEWDSPQLWTRSILRSGLLSPAGDMASDAILRGEVTGALGPVGDMGAGLLFGISNAARDAWDGDTDEAAAKVARTLERTFAPNIWWMDAMMTKAMDAVMWELDPDYIRDRERRWSNEGRVD